MAIYTVRSETSKEETAHRTWKAAVNAASRMNDPARIIERDENGERAYNILGDPIDDESFTVGDTVRFAEALEPGDDDARFVVTEDNGDRLFVRLVCDLPIPPTSLVRRSEMVKV